MKLGRNDFDKITEGEYSVIEKAYSLIIENGKQATQLDAVSEEASLNAFCRILVSTYISWQDYIHANNLMQTFKRVVPKAVKQPWFNRASITIYGKRTPLYFIENPTILMDKICSSIGKNDERDTGALCGVINDLFDFLFIHFIEKETGSEFEEKVKRIFIPFFEKNLENLDIIPNVKIAVQNFIQSILNPTSYDSPGILIVEDEEDEFPLWESKESVENHNLFVSCINTVSSEENDLILLKGRTIVFLGEIGPSIKTFIQALSKKYLFKSELYEYSKLSNVDITKLQYSSKKIAGIIVGAVPHSVKNMGSHSSILQTITQEPGYPRTFECRANSQSSQLKFSKTSIKNALAKINEYLKSLE